MATDIQDIVSEDIEYLRHGDRKMMLRLTRPAGAGPFSTIVDLHGGAWCMNDLSDCDGRDEVLVEAGFATAALDFRHAEDGYPSSLIDINYAIRWLKAEAANLSIDVDRMGLAGQSSGGHLAMLCAMRPADSRYASIPLSSGVPSVDARVRCVGMIWPVINPLSRYHHALRRLAQDEPAGWAEKMPGHHHTYWGTEDNMADGNPVLALENGEAVETPPAIWIQGRPDDVHDYRDPDSPVDLNEPERFAHGYRQAGGEIDLVFVDYDTRVSRLSWDPLAAFFRKHL